jgi:carbon catabolite-derepressing protein kinase
MLEDAEIDWFETGHFTLLDSSLVQQGGGSTPTYEGEPILIDSVGRQHTLESYERSRSARRGRQGFSNGGAQPSPPITSLSSTARPVLPHVPSSSQAIKPPRWNFGIRSSSPPMEVMCELYRSIKHLGAAWREKDHPWSFVALPYPPMDHDDITPATDIFFVQTRWTLRGHSVSSHPIFILTSSHKPLQQVRVDIQLYQVHASNYLLDFRNVGHLPLGDPNVDGGHTNQDPKYHVTNPFLFLEVCTKLITHLAEGA